MNYPKLAFTDTIRRLQERYGSRPAYERMEKHAATTGMTPREYVHIAERDSFYMASIGENGFPYIQHRGGPRGFVRVLDPETLGFLDFTGNMQYISVGNIQTRNRVALILVDYPRRRRLKIYAEAEVLPLEGQETLVEKLSLDTYKAQPERIVLLHVKAFDWNCPQHITPRYTEDEIQGVIDRELAYIAQLEGENQSLKRRLAELGDHTGLSKP